MSECFLFKMADAKSLRTAVKKPHAEGVPSTDIARRLGITKSTVYSNLID